MLKKWIKSQIETQIYDFLSFNGDEAASMQSEIQLWSSEEKEKNIDNNKLSIIYTNRFLIESKFDWMVGEWQRLTVPLQNVNANWNHISLKPWCIYFHYFMFKIDPLMRRTSCVGSPLIDRSMCSNADGGLVLPTGIKALVTLPCYILLHLLHRRFTSPCRCIRVLIKCWHFWIWQTSGRLACSACYTLIIYERVWYSQQFSLVFAIFLPSYCNKELVFAC